MRKNERRDALQAFQRAADIAPNYAIGYYDLGVILAKRKGRKDCSQALLRLWR